MNIETEKRAKGPLDDPRQDTLDHDLPPETDFSQFALPFDRLDESVPLLLLPIRIETRYRPTGSPTQLLVRIYPDQIHIERDVPPATTLERDVTIQFWTDWHGTSDTATRSRAWRRFSDAAGRRRARQLADTFRPTLVPNGPLEFPGLPPLPPPTEPRPARAALLPRQWVVTGYDAAGNVMFQRGSLPVAAVLQTGSSATAPTWDVAASGIVVDDALAWMVDYDRAEEDGMAVTIDLTGAAAAAVNGVATLIVTGVDADLDRGEAADALTTLLESHRATDGLAFVPQGTPTNNTDDLTSGWTSGPSDPVATIAAASVDGPDNATRFTRLLGLGDAGRWRTLARGTDPEFADAQAMRIAMFEVVLGVLARQLLDVGDEPAVDDDVIDQLREWFIDHVTGGAPVPTIRVGTQPYGILPVRPTSAEPDLATVVGRVEHVTQLLVADWQRAVASVPVIDHGATDSGSDLPVESVIASILATQPHPARLQWRQLDSYSSLNDFERLLTPQFFYELVLMSLSVITNPNLVPPYTYVGSLYFALAGDSQNDEIAHQVALWREMDEAFPAWLASEGGTDRDDEALDFIRTVRTLVESYADRQLPLPQLDLDRRAVALGRRFAGANGTTANSPINTNIVQATLYDSTDEWGEAGLVEAAGAPSTHSAANYLAQLRRAFDQRNNDIIGVTPYNDDFSAHPPLLFQLLSATVSLVPHRADAERRFSAALERLAALDADSLEWLMRESLGLGTHRLDAWHTSIAAARLDRARSTRPEGLQIGAFGLVTDLTPSDAGPSEGFIHAPSMAQAGTAALLRCGWLAHGDDDPRSAFAIDLSSRRVRDARWLLDSITGGQPLGEVLGQRFERALHDAGNDDLIRPTRQAVLTAQGRPEASADEPVDGIDLLDLVRAEVEIGSEARAALDTVEAAFDAANDLAIAEGVHQLAAGNYGRASAMLDAVATGTSRPPEPEVVRTHRRGTSIEHRVVIVLPAGVSAKPTNGWQQGLRDRVAPQLETFVAALLPSPADVGFAVATEGTTTAMSLADLGLSALDAVHLIAEDPAAASPAFATLVACAAGGAAPVEIDTRKASDRPIALAEFGVLAVEIRRLIDRARVGDVRDLRPAADAGEATPDHGDVGASIAALVLELSRAVADLRRKLDAGDPRGLAVLVEPVARFGLACPGSPNDLTAVRSLVDTAQARLSQLASPRTGTPRAAAPGRPIDVPLPRPSGKPVPALPPTDEERVALLFSHGLPLLATFDLTGASTPDAHAAPDPGLASADELDDWLDAVGRTRPEIGRLTHIGLLADTLAGGGFSACAGQHPRFDGEPWVATHLPTNAGGRLAVTAIVGPSGAPRVGDRVCALVLDRWVEQIPASEQVSGVAFHYDAPSNQAPQTCLLAVTQDDQQWSLDLVLSTLLETVDWIRMRSVAAEDLAVAGRAIPSTFTPGAIKPWIEEVA